MRKPVLVVSDNVQTNLAVQPQRWLEVNLDLGSRRGLYCLCSENKGADQLICTFVFAYVKSSFSHVTAQIEFSK